MISSGQLREVFLTMDLKSTHSVAAFFQEVLSAAIKNQGVDTSEPTECYLVNLLATFTKTPIDDEPLALKMASAQVASPDEREIGRAHV
jgi:hypothetical protein